MSRGFEIRDGFPVFSHLNFEHGIRGDRVPEAGRPAVVCIGCSHTYGSGVDDDGQTWPAFLEEALGGGVQVLNMGRRNYGLKLAMDWYRKHTAPLDVRVCILQVPLFCRQPLPGLQPDAPQCYTANFGPMGLYGRGEVSAGQFVRASPQMMARDLDRLTAFCAELRAAGTLPVVLNYRTPRVVHHFPELAELVEIYAQDIRRACAREGIALCDRDDLSNLAFSNYGMLADFTHANARGNRYIARLLRETAGAALA